MNENLRNPVVKERREILEWFISACKVYDPDPLRPIISMLDFAHRYRLSWDDRLVVGLIIAARLDLDRLEEISRTPHLINAEEGYIQDEVRLRLPRWVKAVKKLLYVFRQEEFFD